MEWIEALNALGARHPEILRTNGGGPAHGRRRLHTLALVLRNDGYAASQVLKVIADDLSLAITDEQVVLIANAVLSFWPGA